jgi:hypothetical protein
VKINKNFFVYAAIILYLLLFLKIDYRFISEITCCGDDFDYFIHAKTIALDNDFDYSNNLISDSYFYKYGNVIAPKGFVGSGMLAAPFLYFGSILNDFYTNSDILNYQIFLYSLSAVFYFLMSIILLNKSFALLKINVSKFFIFLMFFGSGLPYYAFERYSMTHTYEVFINSVLFFLVIALHKESNSIKINFLILAISLSVCMGLLVRWTNYYIFFLPLLYKLLISEIEPYSKKVINRPITYFGVLSSSYIFYWLSKNIYGRFILDPRKIYGESKEIKELLTPEYGVVNIVFGYCSDILNILFGNEFGIFWTSPILFIFIPLIVIFIFKKKYKIALILSILFLQIFGVVIIWQSTASSYGYRYLFSLIPISIIIFLILNKNHQYNIFKSYLIPFSIFSTISVLFFETNSKTQLSLIDVHNSFGKLTKYTQPDYVSGYINSFNNIESYQIIFLTSFLGALIFKILQSLAGYEDLLEILSSYGLPVSNQDFLEFYLNIYEIEYFKFIFVILFFWVFTVKLYKKF